MMLFFTQQTAYEMRIRDWSSDVCSSDLVLEVLPIALGEVTREQRVVVAPDHQGRRLVLAEQRLPLRLERDVVAVVVEQRELDRLVAGAVEQVLHVPEVVRADPRAVPGAGGELPDGALQRQEGAQPLSVGRRGIGPVERTSKRLNSSH